VLDLDLCASLTVRDVGLFRYWKASNIPLFLVAAPMILVWLLSGLSLCSARGRVLCVSDIWKPGGGREGNLQTERLLRSMALPQLIMAIAALGVYHVQIVNRLASAHPIWTIWLALHFTKRPRDRGDAGHQPRWHALVRVMIMYGVVQAGLFASFMPPA
jgi:phosphatidylinositol glycan class V